MKSRHPEYQYLDLVRDTLTNGEKQIDAGTGIKTYSVFGKQIRFDLSQGLPLLTTKKVYSKRLPRSSAAGAFGARMG